MTSTRTGAGRQAQQRRTRQALLRAARDLIAAGATPTLTEVADAADVSRATAYRHFTQAALLREAVLLPGLPSAAELFAGPDAPSDPEERVALVHRALYKHVREREAQFRVFFANAVLDSDPDHDTPRRPGFRLQLFDAALAPLEGSVPRAELTRLKHGLSVLTGTEAFVAGQDVLRLDHDVAINDLEWACRQLVRAVRQAHESRT